MDAREGNSEVWFGLYRKTGDGPNDYTRLTGPVGGVVYIGVHVKVGAGERLQPGQDTLTVRIREDSDLHADPENRKDCIPVDLTSAGGWFKQTSTCGATQETWEVLDKAPNYDNHDEGIPLILRTFIAWDTTTQPLGHNEQHSIFCQAINGYANVTELTFEKWQNPGWGSAYASGPDGISVQVKNLVITNVATPISHRLVGLDPNSGQPASVSFTFEDTSTGDTHYDYTVSFTDTLSEEIGTVEGSVDAPGTVQVSWDGSLPEGYTARRGVYQVRVTVKEIDNATNAEVEQSRSGVGLDRTNKH